MDYKTPSTLLHEFLKKKKSEPEFRYLNDEEAWAKSPEFVFEVSALGQSAIGSGSNKKIAKQNAAKKLLELLNPPNSSEEDTQITWKGVELENGELRSDESNIEENFMSLLSEYCTQLKIPSPIYDIVSREGPPNLPIFKMKCSVLFSKGEMLYTEGEGRTKKEGKHKAAKQMYLYIKDKKPDDYALNKMLEESDKYPPIDIDGYGWNETQKELASRLPLLDVPTFYSSEITDFDALFKAEQFLNSDKLRQITGRTIEYLRELPDPFKSFMELIEELGLYCTFDDIPSRVKMVAIVVPLLKNTTFFGMGNGRSPAFQSAAISGLKWFAVMSKPSRSR